jgi:arginyl-tRNA synthetase
LWGADHHGYVPRINAFWEAMGYKESKRLDVLLYQLVNLKRGNLKVSMSTRAGEFVTLKEVIDEALGLYLKRKNPRTKMDARTLE